MQELMDPIPNYMVPIMKKQPNTMPEKRPSHSESKPSTPKPAKSDIYKELCEELQLSESDSSNSSASTSASEYTSDNSTPTLLVSPENTPKKDTDNIIMIDWEKELDFAYQELRAAEAEANYHQHPEDWITLDEC